MIGILKIAKAEFIKIFKKPSVYIMGIILSLAIVFSLFGFSPVTNVFSTTISGSTTTNLYNQFLTNNLNPDSKYSLDNNFDKTNNILEFYESLSKKQSKTDESLTAFLENLKLLEQTQASDIVQLNEVYDTLKDSLNTLLSDFENDYTLSDYSFYSIYKSTPVYINSHNILETLTNYANINDAISFKAYYNTNKNSFSTQLNSINKSFIVQTVNYYKDLIIEVFNQYHNEVQMVSSPTPDTTQMEIYRTSLNNHVNNYQTYLKQITDNVEYIIILSESKNIVNNDKFLAKIKEIINNDNTFTNLYDKHKQITGDLYKLGITKQLNNFTSSLSTVNIDYDEITDLKEYINNISSIKSEEILNNLNTFMSMPDNQNSNKDENMAEVTKLLTYYKSLSLNVINYTTNTINLIITNDVTADYATKLYGFEDFNKYQSKEENTKIQYLFSTNTYNNDYSNVLSINQNSTTETTVFDFMIYALKISSILIIVFAIIMSSNILANEFDTGTFKLLAIRPYSRGKILFGKLLAVMIFVIIFVLFSAIVSLIAGITMYGFALTPALAVFNATTPFVISPILLILINILTIILEVLFYAIIAITISTIFKSFAPAMSVSLLVLITALIMNSALGGFIWYSYIPFTNIDFFRFLGGAFNAGGTSSFFTTMLQNNLLTGANFFISLIIYTVSITILTLTSYLVLKKRDF